MALRVLHRANNETLTRDIHLLLIFFFLESQRPASKRRKRKGSTSGPGNNAPPAPSKKRSPGPNFSLASQASVRTLDNESSDFVKSKVRLQILKSSNIFVLFFYVGRDGRR